MSLVTLIDNSSSSLETCPDAFAEFLRDRAVLFPLLMQFLQFIECIHDILILREFFSGFTELLFSLKILLEVEVT